MIVDASGVPFPEEPLAERYLAAVLRSRRQCKATYMLAFVNGWTDAQIQHYIETGEEP